MNTIICPNCGKTVEISEALKHQMVDEVRREVEAENKIAREKEKKEILAATEKKLQEEWEFKMKDSKNELDEAKERNKELQEQLLELNKSIRELQAHNEKKQIEMEKRLNEAREKDREELSKMLSEKYSLEKQELQKQLDDTKKSLEEAQRKAQQKSQQLQGEVLELDLERQLQEAFPTDEITPVPKGVEGGDILHIVKNKRGQIAGAIIWETKRTKAWSHAWVGKLRENTRQAEASTAILVSEILPEGIEKFGMHENIWVTWFEYAVPLASVLRVALMKEAIAKSAARHTDEKLQALYTYLTDNAFRHRFEAQVESIIELRQDLESEQRSTMRVWKKRETQINRMRNNISLLYGELQGIMGPALPTIAKLDLEIEPKIPSLLDD